MEALKKPREDFENVWTSDGNIYDVMEAKLKFIMI